MSSLSHLWLKPLSLEPLLRKKKRKEKSLIVNEDLNNNNYICRQFCMISLINSGPGAAMKKSSCTKLWQDNGSFMLVALSEMFQCRKNRT